MSLAAATNSLVSPTVLGAPPGHFTAWGPSHVGALLAAATCAIVLVVSARRARGSARPRRIARGLALVILIVEGGFQIYSMLPSNWSLADSLPFQLCDLAWMAGAWALWMGSQRAFALLFFWGLTLSSQALVTPVLEFDFPHPQFLMFWLGHGGVVVAAIYMSAGMKRRPRWSDYVFTCTVTAGWALLIYAFNSVAATNYLYVNAKPPVRSALDLMGPWPWYLLAEALVIGAIWALMTLGFAERREARHERSPCSP